MARKQPQQIVRVPDRGLEVTWSDGSVATISAGDLRRACPCASCREQRGEGQHDKPLGTGTKSRLAIVEHSAQESLSLESVRAVGSYAIGLRWADGHDTGIYSFELLEDLSRKSS